MISMVPYKPEHAHIIALADYMQHYKHSKQFDEWARYHVSPYSYTIFKDSQILGCGGIKDFGFGKGEVWMLLSNKGRFYPVTVFRYARKVIEIGKEHFNRLQATVREDVPDGVRFLKLMDFQLEGKCRNYDYDGADVWLMAWVK